MSSAGRNLIRQHYKRVLERWPPSALRPDRQLQDALAKQLETRLAPGKPINEAYELGQLNALYSLLDNRYKTKYRIKGLLLKPRGNPDYYSRIIAEIEEAPKRSWMRNLAIRLSNMVRLR